MKYFSNVVDFAYSWFDVATALLRRYPNPHSKHVLSEDVLDRQLLDDGKLYTIKLLTKTNPLPRWGERFYKGPRFVTIIEESIVDPMRQTYVTYTRNISQAKFMSVVEKCTYKGSLQALEQTTIQKQAWIDSQMGYGLRIPVIEFSMKRYKGNQQKATLGLEHVINNTEPRNLISLVRHSRDVLSEKAKNSKDILTEKARKASELAKNRAEMAKVKACEQD